jgi:hypothetical protein
MSNESLIVDWEDVAVRLVRQCAQLQVGERAVVLHTRVWEPQVAAELHDAIVRAGGVLLAELVRGSSCATRHIRALTDPARGAVLDREDAAYVRLLGEADVLFWLGTGNAVGRPKRWEKILAAVPRVRSVHFHWFMPEDEASRRLCEATYVAAMRVEPSELYTLQSYLVQALQGGEAHITSPEGTDLRLRFPAGARFKLNTGATQSANVADSDAVRSREEEFPASAIRTVDAVPHGTLIARILDNDACDRAVVTFDHGRVTSLTGSGPTFDNFLAAHAAATGDTCQFAEFLLGTNTALQRVLPSGYLPYYATGGGNVQLRIGDNWESGGRNRASDHYQEIFVLTDATVTVSSRTLVDRGELCAVPGGLQ